MKYLRDVFIIIDIICIIINDLIFPNDDWWWPIPLLLMTDDDDVAEAPRRDKLFNFPSAFSSGVLPCAPFTLAHLFPDNDGH